MRPGKLPKRPKGSDCKSDGFAFTGSNPVLATMNELLDVARRIAVQAGELAALRRREGVTVAATKSTVVDIVTEADREIEASSGRHSRTHGRMTASSARRRAGRPGKSGLPGSWTRSTAP